MELRVFPHAVIFTRIPGKLRCGVGTAKVCRDHRGCQPFGLKDRRLTWLSWPGQGCVKGERIRKPRPRGHFDLSFGHFDLCSVVCLFPEMESRVSLHAAVLTGISGTLRCGVGAAKVCRDHRGRQVMLVCPWVISICPLSCVLHVPPRDRVAGLSSVLPEAADRTAGHFDLFLGHFDLSSVILICPLVILICRLSCVCFPRWSCGSFRMQ